MTRSCLPAAFHTVGSGRFLSLFIALIALTVLPGSASAQRPDFRGGGRGGSGDDRGEQMRAFFSQMRSGNASSDGPECRMACGFGCMGRSPVLREAIDNPRS